MAKIVRMVVEVDTALCTGCDMCTRACPTGAFVLRDRLSDEPGKSRKIVELKPEECLNAQRCLEFCNFDALRMVELDEPFHVGVDIASADQGEIAALCAKAGYPPEMLTCVCTLTSMGEMAAAVLAGADTPEKLSLATGARTGCSEICMHPFLKLLEAAGHGDAAPVTAKAFQWYPPTPTPFEQDPQTLAALARDYPVYRLAEELADLALAQGKVVPDQPEGA